MPLDRSENADVRAEAYMAALSFLSAALAGDTEAADVIYDNTNFQPLLVGMTEIAAIALVLAGEDPQAWIAGEQSVYRAKLAAG